MQKRRNEIVPRVAMTGVLLAGGKSQRMDRDKALIDTNGRPLWQHAYAVLRNTCETVLVAGDRSDFEGDLRYFTDTFPGSSLAGIHTGLSHAETDWITVLPCDLPSPSPELIISLQQVASDAIDAVVPRTHLGREPLIACYHKNILPKITERLTSNRLKVLDLLDEIRTRYLEEHELPGGWRRSLKNINTPADLEKLSELPPAVSFLAGSGTGKTSLIEKLIGELSRRGWTVGALKHDAHNFDIDHRGKDSWRMTQAGAKMTAISSPDKTAIVHQHALPLSPEELLEPFRGKVDIVLTEGFRQSTLPKIRVYRSGLAQPPLNQGNAGDANLIAVASDIDLKIDIPRFDLNNPVDLVQFIEDNFLA